MTTAPVEAPVDVVSEQDGLSHAFCLLCYPDHGTGKAQVALCGWVKVVPMDLGRTPPANVCGICLAFLREPCPLCGGAAL